MRRLAAPAPLASAARRETSRNALEMGFRSVADLVHVDQRKWPDREHFNSRPDGWVETGLVDGFMYQPGR